jgi:hypothetical protein
MRKNMKITVAMVLAVAAATAGIAWAEDVPTVTRTGPNGKPLVLRLDGRYSTCLRDSQRLGYSHESAKRYCDAKPNLKR